jgi:hypothetical protein
MASKKNDTARCIDFHKRGQIFGDRGSSEPHHEKLADLFPYCHTCPI